MSSAHSVTRFVKRQEALSYRRETALRSKLLSRRSQQRERLNASMLSIYLFVCLFVSVAKMQKKTRFSQKLSNLELYIQLYSPSMVAQKATIYSNNIIIIHTTWQFGVYLRPIGSYVIGFFKEPIRSLKSKMAEIRHLENRHDVIFFCRWWSDLDKISETGAE